MLTTFHAIHHTQQSIDAMNATGALVIFLPPYSPDLMPWENCLQKQKAIFWITKLLG